MDEQEYVQRARDGDETAFEWLVGQYTPLVLRVATRFLGPGREQEAADVVQAVWIKVWRKLRAFRGDSAFSTWLYRVAVRKTMDESRKRARRQEVALEEGREPRVDPDWGRAPSRRPDPVREAWTHERMERFERALAALSEAHRMTLILREVEGRSYREIAGILRCREGTVMSRLHHARSAIRAELESDEL